MIDDATGEGASVRDEPHDDPGHRRLVAEHDGEIAELVYRDVGNRMILVHTGVPDDLAGHGLGGKLVRAAIERARQRNATVVPWCPFARRWLQEHPDVAATVPIDWTPPPGADD
jgi:predicted GNAT family acetyltransferase